MVGPRWNRSAPGLGADPATLVIDGVLQKQVKLIPKGSVALGSTVLGGAIGGSDFRAQCRRVLAPARTSAKLHLCDESHYPYPFCDWTHRRRSVGAGPGT